MENYEKITHLQMLKDLVYAVDILNQHYCYDAGRHEEIYRAQKLAEQILAENGCEKEKYIPFGAELMKDVK